jgi:hypothetical protein
LVNQDKLSSKLLTGLMSSNGSIKVKENTVIGDGVINLTSLTMQAQGSNKMTNIVANTLNQLEQLSINSDVGGVIGDLDLSFSSDLNRQLGSALLANIGKEEQGKLDELKDKLKAQMQAALGSQDAQLAEGDIDSLEDLLNSKMNNAIDSKKDELKDKLKGKIFG